MSNRLRRACAALVLTLLAGGAGITFADPAAAEGPTSFNLAGHGFGHGRGLGQWGARGYADDHGWTTNQILGHFYGGTSAGSRDPGTGLRILLCDMEGVTICGNGLGVSQAIVTSGAGFAVEGAVIQGGTAVRMTRINGVFQLDQAPGGCSATAWTPLGTSTDGTVEIDSTVSQPGDDKTKMLELCGPKKRTYRGVLRYTMANDKPRLINFVGIDDYLKGVVPSEMPASWNPAAIRAQAVAARSYALAGDSRFPGVAETCDTIQCQVYLGASNEQATTNAAIAQTAGQVRLNGNGTVARTEFSASTGGWTTGGTFPAVVDEGDDREGNPHHNWNVVLQATAVESAYGIADVAAVEVTKRNGRGADGGRATEVKITPASGAVQTVTGDAFRSKMGLKSDWFTVTPVGGGGPSTPPPPPAPTGPSIEWLLRDSATPGPPARSIRYGIPAYQVVSCDWNNDGTDDLGVYDKGAWFLRDGLTAGSPTRSFSYGAAGYVAVCGDWDGDGQDSIGVYDTKGYWFLRNDVGPGQPQIAFQYGYAAATPVVGNWDASDPASEIGVFDAGAWSLRNDVGPGQPQQSIGYGFKGTRPVIGDWDGDGVDGFGVYDKGAWFQRETTTPGNPQRSFEYGYAGTTPVVGRWATAADGVGIIIPH